MFFNKGKEIKKFIKKRIKFYPFQNLFLSGFTDYLSFNSYIPSINFQRIGNLHGKINHNIYKIGLTIVNSLKEIYHVNQYILYFKGINKSSIYTEGKKEGGKNLEDLLFGKIINNVNLFQSLYIMNEENYSQNLKEFRENFKNLNDIILKTNGKTKFIEIKKGIFKKFYKKCKLEIKTLIINIKNDSNYIPAMTIRNSNKDSENDNYLPKKKCLLIGGRKISE